jgi:hypothetical protein
MAIKFVSIENVIQTHDFPRREHIENIKQTIITDGSLDYIEPIYCLKKQNQYYILDGTHRSYAIKELGFKEILIEYDD